MKKKNFFKLVLGLGALAIALSMNFSYAANDYGIRSNTLSLSAFVIARETTETGAAKKYCKYTYLLNATRYFNCTGMPGVKEKRVGDFHECERDKTYTGTSCKNGFKGIITTCMDQEMVVDNVQSYFCP